MLLQTKRIAILLLLALGILCTQADAFLRPKSSYVKTSKQKSMLDLSFGVPAFRLRGGGGAQVDSAQALQATRGGGDADTGIDKSDTWTISDIEIMDVVYACLSFSLLAAVCLFCRSVARSGGRAPDWITSWVADPYATAILHSGYFVLGAFLPLLLPAGLCRVIFSPPAVALLGTVFPAIESVRAAVTDSGADDRTWLMYWVVYGIFQYTTEFIDQLAQKNDNIYTYWHTFEVLVVTWLVLPITDGATLIYNTLAQPYLLPLVTPIKNAADGWVAGIALTAVNASYIWWFSFIFMQLPITVKRYSVMIVGSVLPVASTIMALASTADNSEVRWLTYWPCFSLLFIIMIGVEKFVGSFKGLYVMTLAATLYLMLPMFDGSMKVFRNVLVPLCQQQELLIIRDAQALAGELLKKIPVDRQEYARQEAANAFVVSTESAGSEPTE